MSFMSRLPLDAGLAAVVDALDGWEAGVEGVMVAFFSMVKRLAPADEDPGVSPLPFGAAECAPACVVVVALGPEGSGGWRLDAEDTAAVAASAVLVWRACSKSCAFCCSSFFFSFSAFSAYMASSSLSFLAKAWHTPCKNRPLICWHQRKKKKKLWDQLSSGAGNNSIK